MGTNFANTSCGPSLGQTAISLGRAVGPALGGTIWSWSLGNGLHAPLDFHLLVKLSRNSQNLLEANTTCYAVSSRAPVSRNPSLEHYISMKYNSVN